MREEHDYERDWRWGRVVLWVIAGIGFAMILGAVTDDARAHRAIPTAAQPLGWQYPISCCSGTDCAEIPDEAVKETPDGYLVSLLPGQHPMVTKEPFSILIPYNSIKIKNSPDGLHHICISRTGHLFCFFAGPRGY